MINCALCGYHNLPPSRKPMSPAKPVPEGGKIAADVIALRELQVKVHHQVHDLTTILTVLLGEIDLSVIRVRKELDAFYDKYPELK